MRITGIDCHVLLDPGFDPAATSSSQDDIVVEIHTDAGITGIGETDLNAWVARALIEAPGMHTMDTGFAAVLIGQDPLDPELWQRLYVATAMTGRRGAGIHAIGALDLALWDIRGKAHGVPVHELLGRPAHDHLTPYASLMPQVGELDAYPDAMVDLVLRSRALGFRAAKLEIIFDGPYASMGLRASDDQATAVIAAVRDAVGADFTLMVDVGYAFDSAARALRVLEQWAAFDLYFVETPLSSDDLAGYAALARHAPMRIAAGEWLATRYEFEELLDRGEVQVAQPDIGRVGGLTEAMRVAELAADRGTLVVPHAWKSGITIAAAAHFATVTSNCPFFEFVPASLAESAIRRELVADELVVCDGRMPLPARPGLGVDLDPAALARFAAAAGRLASVESR